MICRISGNTNRLNDSQNASLLSALSL